MDKIQLASMFDAVRSSWRERSHTESVQLAIVRSVLLADRAIESPGARMSEDSAAGASGEVAVPAVEAVELRIAEIAKSIQSDLGSEIVIATSTLSHGRLGLALGQQVSGRDVPVVNCLWRAQGAGLVARMTHPRDVIDGKHVVVVLDNYYSGEHILKMREWLGALGSVSVSACVAVHLNSLKHRTAVEYPLFTVSELLSNVPDWPCESAQRLVSVVQRLLLDRTGSGQVEAVRALSAAIDKRAKIPLWSLRELWRDHVSDEGSGRTSELGRGSTSPGRRPVEGRGDQSGE